MLPELEDTSNQRCFYSLYNRKVRTVNLPLSSNPNNNIRLLSSHGWLLSVTDHCNNLCLVNPLSNAIINLPKARFWSHLHHDFDYFNHGEISFEKLILSGNPSSSSDFTIALVLAEPFANLCCRHEIISFWRNDNHQWEPILEVRDSKWVNYYNDIIFYKGKFYSVDNGGTIWSYQLDHSGCPHERVVAELKSQLPNDMRCQWDIKTSVVYYLVESENHELLVVCRVKVKVDKSPQTVSFKVFELNVDNGKAKTVPNLGDVAVFVVCNSSFSTKASSAHGIKHNSIYFTDDYRAAHDIRYVCESKSRSMIEMGIFSLTDENIHQLDLIEPLHFSKYAPYLWLEDPSL